MNHSILDSRASIAQLDSQNMLGSIELLKEQVADVIKLGRTFKLPLAYKKVANAVVLGMGGSTLPSHIIQSLFQPTLLVPIEVVNGYHVPGYVGPNTLVVASSYSGTTAEPLAALGEAHQRGAKIVTISSGGELAERARKLKVPQLIFSTEHNPCGSPRMGLGLSLVGQLLIFARAGVIKLAQTELVSILKTVSRFSQQFGVAEPIANNPAKQLALQTVDKSVWYVASEHLVGNAHVGVNQMNENAKRFAGFFSVPELNHHLMEGLKVPSSNSQTLLFVLIESRAYDARVQKRYAIGQRVLEQYRIPYAVYHTQAKKPLAQVFEVLAPTSFASFYSALLAGIDPTAIPVVDFFKQQLN